MNPVKAILFSLAVTATVLAPLKDADAWVAARGGYRGGAVAVGGYHGGYGYHPGGCYGCGAAAGAVAGLAVGSAIAHASQPTYVVQQPAVVVQSAPVYVQQPVYAAQGNLPIGTQLAVLPPGSNSMVVNGANYYQNGPTWYKPYYGSSGVYYQVVPAP